MKNLNSIESGVTLVALVITIIVLLILAGVSIALIIGDNGILNQAVNAADETNRANAQTELEMAVSAVVADWSGARYLEGNDQTLEEYMTKDRVEVNMNTDEYDLKEFSLNIKDGVTVGYKNKDYKFTVEITSSGNSAKVTYTGVNDSEEKEEHEDYVVVKDGTWDEEKKVNSPNLMPGMTAVYWDEDGVEKELTDESSNSEWYEWYDYNGQGDGQNKWANAITKDENGNTTGYWVWIPRYAYKIESGLFTSTAGTISVKFLKNTSDLDENDTEISREYAYSGDAMTDFVVHPAFRDGTSNNFMNGEWDEEVSGFWVAKYEAGYQNGSITDDNGVLSTEIRNDESEVIYSDINYTAYRNDYQTNSLNQALNATEYSNQKISYPVFLPLTYSYNLINIGDSFIISESVDTASIFYGLDSSQTDSHLVKNSEWGAVAYLSQSNYGRNGNEINTNNYGMASNSFNRTSITGLAGQNNSSTSTSDFNSVYAYYTEQGMTASSTGNITGVYDLNGGNLERVAGYISNGNGQLISVGNDGTSGSLMGATNVANPQGYQTLSKRNYTIYPYNSTTDLNSNNYTVYKSLLKNNYGFGDAILETSSTGSGLDGWNQDSTYFATDNYSFFARGGNASGGNTSGVYNFDGAYRKSKCRSRIPYNIN